MQYSPLDIEPLLTYFIIRFKTIEPFSFSVSLPLFAGLKILSLASDVQLTHDFAANSSTVEPYYNDTG